MKRILAVNPFGIGDAIFTLRVLEGLKNSSDDTLIDVVGNERTADLLRAHSAVHDVYVFNRDRIRALRSKDPLAWAAEYKSMIDAWRSRKYDLMLDYSLGREFSFLGFLAGIPLRTGLDHKRRGVFLNRRISFDGYNDRSVFEYQADVLGAVDLTAVFPQGRLRFRLPSDASASGKRFLREFGAEHKKRLAIAPGGGKSWGDNAKYKQWDSRRFVQVADRWSQETGGTVVLIGDESEKNLIREVSHSLNDRHAVMIGYSLPEVMAVLQECQSFLGNDGGLAHLAHALGVPTAVIFGPVPHTVYAPHGPAVPLAVLKEDVPCRPCYQRFHFPPCGHERVCLDALSVESVYAGLKKIS